MTPPRDFALVFWREVTERVRSRSFQATTAFIAIVSLVATIAAGIGSSRSGSSSLHRLAVVGTMPPGLESAAAQMAAEAPGTRIEVRAVADEAAGRSELEKGRLDALVVTPSRAVVLRDGDTAEAGLLLRALRRAEVAGRLLDAGYGPEEASRLVGSSTVGARIEVLRPFSIHGGVAGIAAVATVVFLFLFGTWIAQGVVQETASGVSSIMLATCPPTRFIVGKTLGVGVVALLQTAVGTVPYIMLVASRTHDLPVSAGVVARALVWFAVAFAIYGHLYAAVGAWGRRVEKVSGLTVWVNLPLVVMAFGGIMAAVLAPTAGLATLASFFPLSAPFAMPVRSAATDLSWWQVPLALILAVGTAVVVARLSARLYVRGLSRP